MLYEASLFSPTPSIKTGTKSYSHAPKKIPKKKKKKRKEKKEEKENSLNMLNKVLIVYTLSPLSGRLDGS